MRGANKRVVMPKKAIRLPPTGDMVEVRWIRKLPGGAKRTMSPWLGQVMDVMEGEAGPLFVIKPRGEVFGDDA